MPSVLDNWKTILAVSSTLVVAGIWLGTLQSKVNQLNPDAIESAQTIALQEIAKATSRKGQLPPGTIVPFGGPIAEESRAALAEAGWLFCDGAAVSRTEYPALFTAIGNSWGDPGSTTFNLPDLSGRFLRGVDGGRGNDPDRGGRGEAQPGGNTGDMVGSVQSDATRRPNVPFTTSDSGQHSHLYTDPRIGDCKGHECGGGSASEFPPQNAGTTGGTGNHSHVIAGGGDKETRPKNANVNFLIRY